MSEPPVVDLPEEALWRGSGDRRAPVSQRCTAHHPQARLAASGVPPLWVAVDVTAAVVLGDTCTGMPSAWHATGTRCLCSKAVNCPAS